MFKLVFLFLFFSFADAGTRYPIKQSVSLTDRHGHEVHLDASDKVSFEVEGVSEKTSQVQLINSNGESAGVFSIPTEKLQEIIRKSIQSGIKEITMGAKNKTPGCCDVEAPKAGRDLAIENIPIPRQKPKKEVIPVPRQKPEQKVIPIPRQKPKREPPKTEAPAKPAKPEAPETEEESSEPVQSGICGLYQKFKKDKDSKSLPDDALKQALMYYQKNPKQLRNKGVVTIADYSSNSMNERFFILDMKKGTVTKKKVSHGGSGTQFNKNGQLNSCKRSNGTRKNMTRDGFFTTGPIGYSYGKAWPKRKVKPYKNPRDGKITKYQNFMGLVSRSPGVNDDAVGYVMHEAKYNGPGKSIMGRSHGCPAFVPGQGFDVWDKIKGGSLYYSYAPVCKDDHKKVLKQVPGWKKLCK